MKGGTAVAQRVGASAATAAPPRRGRATWVGIALAFLALGLVAVSLWTVRGLAGVGVDPAELDLPGGVLRVNAVTPEQMSHPAGMPASMMPDPVPSGFRRVSVDVVLLAESETGLAYDAADFRLGGSGVDPVGPEREGLGSGVVPEGARLDAALVFEVPDTATELELSAAGSDDVVTITLPPVEEGHEGGHAPDEPVGGVTVVPGTGPTD